MNNDLLTYNADLLKKQLSWLLHSYTQAKDIAIKDHYTISEFDIFENLSSRFARTVDFLIRKLFRSLDDAEFEAQGTLVDVVNNAHKRNLFDSIEDVRAIKDLRNAIAHAYIDEELEKLFEDLLNYSSIVIKISETTLHYINSRSDS